MFGLLTEHLRVPSAHEYELVEERITGAESAKRQTWLHTAVCPGKGVPGKGVPVRHALPTGANPCSVVDIAFLGIAWQAPAHTIAFLGIAWQAPAHAVVFLGIVRCAARCTRLNLALCSKQLKRWRCLCFRRTIPTSHGGWC